MGHYATGRRKVIRFDTRSAAQTLIDTIDEGLRRANPEDNFVTWAYPLPSRNENGFAVPIKPEIEQFLSSGQKQQLADDSESEWEPENNERNAERFSTR